MKNVQRYTLLAFVLVMGLGFTSPLAWAQDASGPLRVVATIPELGSLARDIGGDRVTVAVLAKGTEDAHFVEARPSFIKEISEADAYVQSGLDLELGWAPVLLQNARNSRVLPGAPGYIDVSEVITPLDVPSGPVDRSMGDVHPTGNPHYLTDPLNGLLAARLLQERLGALRPQHKAYFDDRYRAFRQRLGAALVGEMLVKRYEEFEKLALLFEHGQLAAFLQQQGETDLLGGWCARMLPHAGVKAVADHNLWPYFARRFQIAIVGVLEPKPGLAPTTRHLQGVIETMRAERVPLLLAAAYYDPRPAQFVASHIRARVVPMAHQVGSRPGVDDYLGMIDYNVQQIAAALGR